MRRGSPACLGFRVYCLGFRGLGSRVAQNDAQDLGVFQNEGYHLGPHNTDYIKVLHIWVNIWVPLIYGNDHLALHATLPYILNPTPLQNIATQASSSLGRLEQDVGMAISVPGSHLGTQKKTPSFALNPKP